MDPRPGAVLVTALALSAGLAAAHDGPEPLPGYVRQLHDCADDYGNHAGLGLTQWGHGLVNLDVGEAERGGERLVLLFLVLDKQLQLLNGTDTRETIAFTGPPGTVNVTIEKLGSSDFHWLGGVEPVWFDGPLEVVDSDVGGVDPGRYAVELGFRYAQLGVGPGDVLSDFHVHGEVRWPLGWTAADEMVGGYSEMWYLGLFAPVPGCVVGEDEDAYVGPPYVIRG